MERYRVGQIVPSSNITMETEIPALLNAHADHFGDVEFTFHSSRTVSYTHLTLPTKA